MVGARCEVTVLRAEAVLHVKPGVRLLPYPRCHSQRGSELWHRLRVGHPLVGVPVAHGCVRRTSRVRLCRRRDSHRLRQSHRRVRRRQKHPPQLPQREWTTRGGRTSRRERDAQEWGKTSASYLKRQCPVPCDVAEPAQPGRPGGREVSFPYAGPERAGTPHTRGHYAQAGRYPGPVVAEILTPGASNFTDFCARGQCVHLTRIFRPHTRCTGPGYEAECIFWPRV